MSIAFLSLFGSTLIVTSEELSQRKLHRSWCFCPKSPSMKAENISCCHRYSVISFWSKQTREVEACCKILMRKQKYRLLHWWILQWMRRNENWTPTIIRFVVYCVCCRIKTNWQEEDGKIILHKSLLFLSRRHMKETRWCKNKIKSKPERLKGQSEGWFWFPYSFHYWEPGRKCAIFSACLFTKCWQAQIVKTLVFPWCVAVITMWLSPRSLIVNALIYWNAQGPLGF